MTKELIFSKKIAKSGQGYLVWIPKDIISYLKLNENSYVEISLKKPESEYVLKFFKKISKSGRGLLVWIPKDVSDYLSLDKDSLCEFRISLAGDQL